MYIELRNEVKIFKKWVLGMRFFTEKLTRPPFGQTKNILKYRVHCMQNVQLGHTVTKQTVN